MKRELPKVYEPQQVENEIYQMWEGNGYFKPQKGRDAKPFTIVMPPPNVTGQLHMGHAMDATLQDTLIRFKRMQGYNALWVPGVDHAGIATQIKVEEELRKEGLTRYDLGREKFLERVWDWKHKYGNRIVEQQKKLGASCDWDRARFTMDEGCSNAVREVFVSLYEKGLIYKGSRIINWCPHCVTALSDAEVEYVDKPGHLWHIRYPLADGSGEVIVATTRPETMLGDSGVCVNPNDARYTAIVGKKVILPLVNKEIPVVADDYAEMEFGTGCVKMTPVFFLPGSKILFTSAKEGYRVQTMLAEAIELYARMNVQLPTGQINRAIHDAMEVQPPRMVSGRRFKCYYAVQTGNKPLRIRLFCNSEEKLDDAYERYLISKFYAAFDLGGVPVKFDFVGKPKQDRSARAPKE